MFARNTSVCVIVMDITHPPSVDHIQLWEDHLHKSNDFPAVIAVINKVDIVEEIAPIFPQIRMRLGGKYLTLFFVSAASGESIGELFSTVAQDAFKTQKQPYNNTKIASREEAHSPARLLRNLRARRNQHPGGLPKDRPDHLQKERRKLQENEDKRL
jgi:50S ribosomal subunit-associated GTPase HflX